MMLTADGLRKTGPRRILRKSQPLRFDPRDRPDHMTFTCIALHHLGSSLGVGPADISSRVTTAGSTRASPRCWVVNCLQTSLPGVTEPGLMITNRLVAAGLAALILGLGAAAAQEPPQPEPYLPGPPPSVPGMVLTPETQPAAPAQAPARASTGLEAESLPGELTEDIAEPAGFRFGPTAVSEVNFLMDYLRLRELFGDSGIRTFGWVEGGYTGASPGSGLLSVQPRQNRFGNEFLLNEIGWVVEKPLRRMNSTSAS